MALAQVTRGTQLTLADASLADMAVDSSKASGYPSAEEQPIPATESSSSSKKDKKKKTKDEPDTDLPTEPFVEKSKEEVDKMSKEDRTKYYKHKMAHEKAQGGTKQKMTKEEMRSLQEAQRKAKEDKTNALKNDDALLEELKLQGLTEAQAKETAKAMREAEIEDEDEDDEEGADDLLGSVRAWMSEQTEVRDDAVNDFNLKVRFQGHVDSTPPDHLGAILKVLVEKMGSECDLSVSKLNPQTVCKALQPALEKWAPLLRSLIETIDVLDAVDVIVKSFSGSLATGNAPTANKDSALVGCLMAVREIDDLIEDDDLVIGCKSVEPTTVVMDKFIEFLEDDDDDDDDDEE